MWTPTAAAATDAEKLEGLEVDCDDRVVPTGSLRASADAASPDYVYVRRPLPDDLSGVIPWKLELVKDRRAGRSHLENRLYAHRRQGTNHRRPCSQGNRRITGYSKQGTTVNLVGNDYKDLFNRVKDDYVVNIAQTSLDDLGKNPIFLAISAIIICWFSVSPTPIRR